MHINSDLPVFDGNVFSKHISSAAAGSDILSEYFLNDYYRFLNPLKECILSGCSSENEIMQGNITDMKEFLLRFGAVRAVEVLSEYEKYLSIGDSLSCSRIQDKLFTEMDLFKNTVVSSIS